MDKIIIGLSGKKGAGKTLCGDIIKEILEKEYKVEVMALADPIKDIAIELFGIPRDICYATNDVKNSTLTDWSWEEIPGNAIGFDGGSEYSNALDKYGKMSVREVLQYIGTDLFRNHMNKDFWVKATLNKIKRSDADVFVITDVRFPNEVSLIRDNGGTIMRIIGGEQDSNDKHPSETALDPIDRLSVVLSEVCATVDEDTTQAITLYRVINNKYYNYILQNHLKGKDLLKFTIDNFLVDMCVDERDRESK